MITFGVNLITFGVRLDPFVVGEVGENPSPEVTAFVVGEVGERSPRVHPDAGAFFVCMAGCVALDTV